jgi:hypothetical protein
LSQARARAGALWLALAVALSPAAFELFRHWMREPWARESMVFVPIAIAGAVAAPAIARPNWGGWLLVAAGLTLALFGSAGGVGSLGRLAIPLAVFGMACAIGRPEPRIASIAFFVVPPPFSIVSLYSPAGERELAGFAVAAARAVGADWSLGDATIRTAAGNLQFGAPDLGIPLAHLLAGLGFCAALAGQASIRQAILRGLLWTLWAVPVQLVALGASLAVLAAFGPGIARAFLDLVPACAVVAFAYPRLRGRRPSRSSAAPRSGAGSSCAA